MLRYIGVVSRIRCAKHHARVALQSREFRALHWRLPERHAEVRLLHRQKSARKGLRILACEKLARLECRLLQRLRELDVERAATLGQVPVYPFCDPALNRRSNSFAQNDLAALGMPFAPTRVR